jgi:glucose/arabinose dehydrogenase
VTAIHNLISSHTASLGLDGSQGTSLPAAFANGMFIGQHGAWLVANDVGNAVWRVRAQGV